jgi:hypothetical protein
MNNLIDILKSLNRKERFFLIADALGNQDFQLGDEFLTKLEQTVGCKIPQDAWVAMDYHLDWLSAALHVCAEGRDPAIPWKNEDVVKGNQEDMDLIVGFENSKNTTLILIEAKMATAWSNAQMNSKAERLGAMFGDQINKQVGVTPIFVLTSPNKPGNLCSKDWPGWMALGDKWHWMPMKVAEGRKRLFRCDSKGKSSKNFGYAVIK